MSTVGDKSLELRADDGSIAVERGAESVESRNGERSLELREVLGPTAFGDTDRKRFKELLWLSAATDFRMRYVDTLLGYFWALARPLFTFGIIFVFLRNILGFGGKIPNFAALLMINIILFQFFQEATNQGLRALASREGLVRKTQFPRIVIPLSTSLTASMTLGFNLMVGYVLLLVLGVPPAPGWLLLPFLAAILVVLCTAISLILSVAYVRMRDIGQVWSVISRAAFWGTPILFPIELVPQSVRSIVALNPLTPIFVEVRRAVIDPNAPGMIEATGSLAQALIPVVLGVLICVFSLWYFVRQAPTVAEAV
jgi:ABC-2 type transport system permease protein